MIEVCEICVMDSSAKGFHKIGSSGCNYCLDFKNRIEQRNENDTSYNLIDLVEKIKREGQGKEYDCIVGVSGGLDSSYTLYKIKKIGLNPLAVHMDNGWNSELAQNNIANIVKRLDVDIYTHVIDWEEYRTAMNAFFEANVIDIELLYDNAMLSVNYKLAYKYGIKYILSGTNTSTEGMKIPSNWSWFKNDKRNIKSICKKFKKLKIKTIPTFGTFDFIKYELLNKIKWIPTPDYFDYKKKDALEILQREFDFKPYPYKHYESVFTRFYQGFLLPKKFKVDKRKLHLSTLIITNQITRDESLKILKESPYPNEDYLEKDIRYFLKKMKWSRDMLNQYIKDDEVLHDNYNSEKKLWIFLARIYKIKNIIKKRLIS